MGTPGEVHDHGLRTGPHPESVPTYSHEFQLEKGWRTVGSRFLSCRSSSVLLADISCGCSSDLSAFVLSAKYEWDEELEFWSCIPKT